MNKRRRKESAADAKKTAQEYIQKNAELIIGATVSFKAADGRILTGTVSSIEEHVLGRRLRVVTGSVVMAVHVDQLV